MSPAGSLSQLSCACKKGQVCLYARQMQVSVFLPVSLGQWLSDAGLRASLVQAVASAAGVDQSRVWITKAYANTDLNTVSARRLLHEQGTTLVRVAVHDGEAFHRLEERLGEAHPRLQGARAHWTPGSRVRVLGGVAFSRGISYI